MKKLSPILLLAACATGNTVNSHVVTGTPQPAYAGQVAVSMEGAPVVQGATEIAILQTRAWGNHANLEHLILGLRTEAASLGCNSVVRVKVDQGASMASATGVCVRTP